LSTPKKKFCVFIRKLWIVFFLLHSYEEDILIFAKNMNQLDSYEAYLHNDDQILRLEITACVFHLEFWNADITPVISHLIISTGFW
jgi:hypothetical protein